MIEVINTFLKQSSDLVKIYLCVKLHIVGMLEFIHFIVLKNNIFMKLMSSLLVSGTVIYATPLFMTFHRTFFDGSKLRVAKCQTHVTWMLLAYFMFISTNHLSNYSCLCLSPDCTKQTHSPVELSEFDSNQVYVERTK